MTTPSAPNVQPASPPKVKPAILTVDDDTAVLNAVERDLRKRYGGEYRIVKVNSGASALDTVRELRARNHPVALFLVDERMPSMTGTEFLTAAKDLYPDARKVLLTAYADTDVAIQAINRVGLDHYLLKPWDPPDEHLYPVLDDLLGEWDDRYRPPFLGIRVAGSRWSPQTHAVKDFLARTHTPYEWIDVDANPPNRDLLESHSPGLARLPVVLFEDGTALVEPGARELAERLKLQAAATQQTYDLIVVGGGPCGLAAAVYGASEGLRTILLECRATGGQAGTSARIENYLGFPGGLSGGDLARRATIQAQRFGAEIVAPREVAGVRAEQPYRVVTLDDGTELRCYALVIATGMEVHRLDCPGVDELTGAGVYYGEAMAEARALLGQNVCVVGGANSAGQAALEFARFAKQVSMVVRGASLTATMSSYLVDRIGKTPNIALLANATVRRALGSKRLEAVEVTEGGAGDTRIIPADGMFIFVGSRPRSDIVADLLERDDRGFIVTGPDLMRDGRRPKSWDKQRDPFLLEGSVPGIFAAGDVRAGSTKRVASAVGEGSAAVSMVHRYKQTV
jgi:thioredoxin reductase (NADPH)